MKIHSVKVKDKYFKHHGILSSSVSCIATTWLSALAAVLFAHVFMVFSLIKEK